MRLEYVTINCKQSFFYQECKMSNESKPAKPTWNSSTKIKASKVDLLREQIVEARAHGYTAINPESPGNLIDRLLSGNEKDPVVAALLNKSASVSAAANTEPHHDRRNEVTTPELEKDNEKTTPPKPKYQGFDLSML